jgi:hypothetical protein
LETYVRVDGGDWSRLGPEAERLAHFIGNRAYMRMHAGRCAALDIRTSATGRREFFCTIYPRRPQVCRDLARGSPACEGELLAAPPTLRPEPAFRAESMAVFRPAWPQPERVPGTSVRRRGHVFARFDQLNDAVELLF